MDLDAVELISVLAHIQWAIAIHISLDIGCKGSPDNSVGGTG